VEQTARDRKDLDIIDQNVERLNREAEDTLDYQQLPSAVDRRRDGEQHS